MNNYEFCTGVEDLGENIEAFFVRNAECIKKNSFRTEYQAVAYMELKTKQSYKIVFYDGISKKLYQTNDFSLVRMFEFYNERDMTNFRFKW